MVLQNFIVFEGIDGAGTSTQIKMLSERTQKEGGTRFLFTAEPTASPTGKFIRTMLRGDFPLTNASTAYLFAADRSEHINGPLVTEGDKLITGIAEACENGSIVVSDRYFFSSMAYQSIDCDDDAPKVANSLFPLPRLLFYFDIAPAVSLSRIGGRDVREIYEKQDYLEKTVASYKKVLADYEERGRLEGMEIIYLDATKSKEETAQIIWNHIQKLPILRG